MNCAESELYVLVWFWAGGLIGLVVVCAVGWWWPERRRP